jgi:hypothetical protein
MSVMVGHRPLAGRCLRHRRMARTETRSWIMSYYNAICLACSRKEWIEPGTEKLSTPRHEGSGYEGDGSRAGDAVRLDADHAAVPISVDAGIAQQRMLDRALEIIRERVPGAVFVSLETSDQDPYGFTLEAVHDNDRNDLLPASAWDDLTHPLADVTEEVLYQISDLNWNGVVGEGRCGYVTIDLRTETVVSSS